MMSISLYLVLISSLMVLGSGCQHAANKSLTIQDNFFKSLKASNPDEERALRYAQYHNLVGRSDLALEELSRANASDPHNIRLLNAMGNCYDRLGQYSKAQEVYEKILAQDADNIPAKNNLAYSCYLSGELSRAEKLFQEILSKNPEYSVARNNLGLVWCRQGKESQALSFWQKDEGVVSAREKLSQVLSYLGKSETRPGDKLQAPEHRNVASQGQAESPPKKSRELASLPRERNTVANQLPHSQVGDSPAKSAQTIHSTALRGKSSQEPQVKIEEVGMIITGAADTQTAPENKVVKEVNWVPPSSPLANEKTSSNLKHRPNAKKEFNLTEDFPAKDITDQQPSYYRPKQCYQPRKPKIIDCHPEPRKASQSIKKYLADEVFYQNKNTSARQNPTFY